MKILRLVAIVSSVLILAGSFASINMQAWALVIAAFAALWIAETARGHLWISHLSLLFFVSTAVYGALLELAPLLMLGGVLSTLLAWDLDWAAKRASSGATSESVQLPWQYHLQAIGLVVLVSMGASLLVQWIDIRLSFWWIVLITLVGMVMLSRALRAFHNEAD